MQRTDLRVMYWPNEPARLYPDFTQAGGRKAFTAMAADGTVSALEIYSYRVERARFDSPAAFERSAAESIRVFAPDILFVQHMFGTDMSEDFWRMIRTEMPGVTLIYHDDDPFDRMVKRVDRATAAILPYAHLVLLSGLGDLANLFESRGATTIRYMPSCFPHSRFAQHDPAQAVKRHDIVMIGSNGRRRRLKFAYVPGGRRRAQFVAELSSKFGTSFALYGGGWTGNPSAKGKVGFFDQEQAIQSGRISANWDHFDHIEYYFSDRLPISLAAGVPHVTTYHKGYERMFRDCPGLYACSTVAESVDACSWLLSRSDADLLDEGMAARNWVAARLEAEPVFRDALEQSVRVHHQVHR